MGISSLKPKTLEVKGTLLIGDISNLNSSDGQGWKQTLSINGRGRLLEAVVWTNLSGSSDLGGLRVTVDGVKIFEGTANMQTSNPQLNVMAVTSVEAIQGFGENTGSFRTVPLGTYVGATMKPLPNINATLTGTYLTFEPITFDTSLVIETYKNSAVGQSIGTTGKASYLLE